MFGTFLLCHQLSNFVIFLPHCELLTPRTEVSARQFGHDKQEDICEKRDEKAPFSSFMWVFFLKMSSSPISAHPAGIGIAKFYPQP
jgi:hypothetical protein